MFIMADGAVRGPPDDESGDDIDLADPEVRVPSHTHTRSLSRSLACARERSLSPTHPPTVSLPLPFTTPLAPSLAPNQNT